MNDMAYFMMRRKLLHRMKKVCGATSHMLKDELIVGEHQVDGTRLIIYIYWASEASPTQGCSIEILRDIYVYMYVCRYVSYIKLTA